MAAAASAGRNRPNSRHLREVFIFCFHLKKSATETHRMLSTTYGETMCREWFRRFRIGAPIAQYLP